MNIILHIDSIAIDETLLKRADRSRFHASIEEALGALIAEQGLAGIRSLAGAPGDATPFLNCADVQVGTQAQPGALGMEVARSIAAALGGSAEHAARRDVASGPASARVHGNNYPEEGHRK